MKEVPGITTYRQLLANSRFLSDMGWGGLYVAGKELGGAGRSGKRGWAERGGKRGGAERSGAAWSGVGCSGAA